MIIHDCIQGSPEWFQARLGIPTASCFDQIITAKTAKPSASSVKYAACLLAERIMQKPLDKFEVKPYWMERGNQLEQEAADMYCFLNDCTVQTAGFITLDDKSAGCSVDRLVGDEGLLEIKCPAPWTHAENIMSEVLDDNYKQQVQGQLYITGRKWVDWMSYHPEMPPSIVRVQRDNDYIDKLKDALKEFNGNLDKHFNKLKTEGKI